LEIVLVDPLRAGDELSYYPGYVNLLRAHVVVISKLSGVPDQNLRLVRHNLNHAVPSKQIIQGDLDVMVETPHDITGQRVLVVEDGPTVTHGDMAFGAGVVAARRFGAREIVDPRPFAAGSLKQVYADFPHLDFIVPAMGYSKAQLNDLKSTLDAVPCDLILSATPVDLRRLLHIDKPIMQVAYEFIESVPGSLAAKIHRLISCRAEGRMP
jgi:predicted GTPase